MQGLDRSKARAHRSDQAQHGFPLLRGCPNTDAIGLTIYLDRLNAADRLSFAAQLSDLDDAQVSNPAMTLDERTALIRGLPLVAAHFGKHFGLPLTVAPKFDIRVIPVKVLAGVMKDELVGGFDGWSKLAQFADDPAARLPSVTHIASLDEVVPVAPRRLRTLIDKAMKQRFGATSARPEADTVQYTAPLTGGGFKVDVRYAPAGRIRQQFDYHFSATVQGRPPVLMGSYETLWRIVSRWDCITEVNADRGVAHFVRVIETCMDLVSS